MGTCQSTTSTGVMDSTHSQRPEQRPPPPPPTMLYSNAAAPPPVYTPAPVSLDIPPPPYEKSQTAHRNSDTDIDLSTLSVEGVCQWLKQIEVDDRTISIFRENCIDGKDLTELETKDLMKKDLKVRPFIAKKIIRRRDEIMDETIEFSESMESSDDSDDSDSDSDDDDDDGYVGKYDKGDKIKVLWSGTAYDATVVKAGPKKLFTVHYDGWDDSYDEHKTIRKMKLRDGTPIKNRKKIKVGMEVIVDWSGTDYEATIVNEVIGVAKIQYDDYSDSWNTWVTRKEVVTSHNSSSSSSSSSLTTVSSRD